jgi:hypothetical protein
MLKKEDEVIDEFEFIKLPIGLQSAAIISSYNLAIYLTSFSNPKSIESAKALLNDNFNGIIKSVVHNIEDVRDTSF